MTPAHRLPPAPALLAASAALLVAVGACAPSPPAPPPSDGAPPAAAPAAPPSAGSFLPPLPGYRTDDTAETGEVRSSLDHGEVPYAEIGRRLVVDERGFARGEVMVVTFEPGAGGPESFLGHWFGDVQRAPAEIAGQPMHRIPTGAHDALVWTGDGFVVVFTRGAEVTDRWLEELAAATVRARQEAAP